MTTFTNAGNTDSFGPGSAWALADFMNAPAQEQKVAWLSCGHELINSKTGSANKTSQRTLRHFAMIGNRQCGGMAFLHQDDVAATLPAEFREYARHVAAAERGKRGRHALSDNIQ